MLVLSRKKGQSIQVGKDIVITVEKFKGDAVILGIEAPYSVNILRTEILSRVSAALSNGTLNECENEMDYQENQ